MDNDIKVFVKLPNPNAGPEYFTTASEVATRHFVSRLQHRQALISGNISYNSQLREILGLPIPRVYAWSSDPSNPVGAEYIIEEEAVGQPLGTSWFQWSKELQLDMVSQIVEVERKLASISFPKHGCIYYKTDLASKGLATESLTKEVLTTESVCTILNPSSISKFAIGPLTIAKHWDGERAKMDLDRGPCKL